MAADNLNRAFIMNNSNLDMNMDMDETIATNNALSIATSPNNTVVSDNISTLEVAPTVSNRTNAFANMNNLSTIGPEEDEEDRMMNMEGGARKKRNRRTTYRHRGVYRSRRSRKARKSYRRHRRSA